MQNRTIGNEKPVHQVTLTNDYYIGKYEVTQTLWETVMGYNPSRYVGTDKPVDSVSWEECQKFISKLNDLTGMNFRFPTEAEWEYAARGGQKGQGYQYSGSKNLLDVGWYNDNSGSKPRSVGSKHANELGLYDMAGNVSEWCEDLYGAYTESSQTDPIGAVNGVRRVTRGGCWFLNARCCRSSARTYQNSWERSAMTGLRLALSEGESY